MAQRYSSNLKSGGKPVVASLHPRNQRKIEEVRRRTSEKAYLTKRRQEAEHDYVTELERERTVQDHEVAELRRTVDELRNYVQLLVQQSATRGALPALLHTPPEETLEPLPQDDDDVDMFASDQEDFATVTSSSRKQKQSSLSAAFAASIRPPPIDSKKNIIGSNQYSSLARASSDSADDWEEDDGVVPEFMDDDMSVDMAADQVKQLSIKKSKPGAPRDGTGRKE